MTPTAAEAKCEDTAIKEAVKFVKSLSKCTDKCTKTAQKGDIAYGACAPANGAAGTGVCLTGQTTGQAVTSMPTAPVAGSAPVSRAIPDKSASRRRRTSSSDKMNGACFGAAKPACYPPHCPPW